MARFTGTKPSDEVVQAIKGEGWTKDTGRNQANPKKDYDVKTFPPEQEALALQVNNCRSGAGLEGGYTAHHMEDGRVDVFVNDRQALIATLDEVQKSGKWAESIAAQPRQSIAKQ